MNPPESGADLDQDADSGICVHFHGNCKMCSLTAILVYALIFIWIKQTRHNVVITEL